MLGAKTESDRRHHKFQREPLFKTQIHGLCINCRKSCEFDCNKIFLILDCFAMRKLLEIETSQRDLIVSSVPYILWPSLCVLYTSVSYKNSAYEYYVVSVAKRSH